MRYIHKVVAFRVTRFGLAGAANTAANFVVLNFVFYGLHQNKLVSSFVATSCAVALSFVLNRNFVFIDKERPMKKLVRFILITAGGVLLIQNSVYALCLVVLHNHEAGVADVIHGYLGLQLSDSLIDVNLSNLIASFAVMFWNYNGYRIFVFKGERRGNEVIEYLDTDAA